MNRPIQKSLEPDAKIVSTKLLNFFAQKLTKKEYLDSVADVIAEWTGFRCVGIRILDSRGGIAYASHVGFSPQFLETENRLSIKGDECACVRIIKGKFKLPDQSAITPKGSFYCEDATRFSAGLTEDQKALFRGACVAAGFRSICLVPIRHRNEIVGAIHLADESAAVLTRNSVEMIESTALLIGEAIFRYRLEKALEESENRYRTLVENSSSGIYLIQDGKIIFANKIFADNHGYPRDEVIGLDSLEIIYPADRRMIEDIRRKRLSGEECLSEYEIRGVKKNGEVIWLQRRNVLIEYQGKPSILGYEIDITDRKRTEEALRASEKELRFLSTRLFTAQEEERERIAHDLHDSIGQFSIAIKMQLENLINRFDPDAPECKSLKNIHSMALEVVKESRLIIANLRPPVIDNLGLLAAISSICARISKDSRIRIEETYRINESEIPEPLKIIIYRILQEALNNVLRHSRADRVQVFLDGINDLIALTVEDNGTGFDINAEIMKNGMGKGVGISSMQERTKLSGGSFCISSNKGSGTSIRAVWPKKNR